MSHFKKFIKRILNKGYYPPVEFKCRTKYLGSGYGGWAIPDGYISKESVVYSFGVGEDISFDLGLIEKFDVVVYAFDPTPKSVAWINVQHLPANFKFQAIGLADFDGNALFIPPDNPQFVSYKMVMVNKGPESEGSDSLPVNRMVTIMGELGHTHIDILKMDIEGSEYAVIDDIKGSNIRPRIILLEFHHRWPEFGVYKTKQAINTLREMGYQLFNVSARDEFGFLLT
jgi:FkbM family methyltransferase